MTIYLAKRLLAMVPVLVIVTFLVFFMTRLIPGDPINLMIPMDEIDKFSKEDLARVRSAYGLDQPIYVQYVKWMERVFHGDLGRSMRTKEPVVQVLQKRLPATVTLALLAMLFPLLISIPLGVLAAVKARTPADTAATVLALAGVSTPHIFLGVALIYIFAFRLRWLPTSGFIPLTQNLKLGLALMIMPAFTMGTGLMGSVMRITRTSLLEVLRQDYITTARSKGLAERVVLFKHALKNAFIPVLTVIGLQISGLLGGAFITEEIFSIPGVGRIAVGAINSRDYPVIQAVVLFFAAIHLVANLVVDIMYGWLDPRVRYD